MFYIQPVEPAFMYRGLRQLKCGCPLYQRQAIIIYLAAGNLYICAVFSRLQSV